MIITYFFHMVHAELIIRDKYGVQWHSCWKSFVLTTAHNKICLFIYLKSTEFFNYLLSLI